MNVEELKELQLKIIKKNKKCNLIAGTIISIIVIISLIIFFTNKFYIENILMSIFFELVISIAITFIIKHIVNGKDIRLFNKNYKSIFVLKALKDNFDNINYLPERGFSEESVLQVGMLNTGDRFSSNDFISGEYKGIKFEQSDIHIEEEHERTDSNGNVRKVWVTLFKGRLMMFDFNKTFKANIQVSSKNFDSQILPWGKKYIKVKMEDLEFNKMFRVYAQSEHDAFYILTPHFMEKMKEVTNKLNCGIMFCFVDNRLHIAIDNNQDSFEYNVFKVINEQEIEADIIKDIKVITDFVNELNLDNDLFRKEV